MGTQARRGLGGVHDDDLAAAGLGDDLLVEQGAATALDQIQVGVYLVRTVDGEVDGRAVFERGERDADPLGGGPDRTRAGDSDDVAQPTLAKEFADALQGKRGGAAGAKADNHARLDEFHRARGRLLLL